MRAVENTTVCASPGEMVDLAELARLHSESSDARRLEDVFGDGVMLATLPVLGRLRELVTGYGYELVDLDELPAIYSVLPLVLLPEILDRRIIPYRANARALLDVANAVTTPVFDEITFEDISPLCLIHHETAHALFFEVVKEQEGPGFRAQGHVTGTRAARRLVETMVESEGFALGLDIFVALFAHVHPRASVRQIRSISAPPHMLPDYERKNPGMVARLVALASSHPEAVLKVLCSGSFIANLRPFATNQVSERFAERVAKFAGIPAGFAVEGRELLSIGLTIDFAFRQRLAPTLFRYLGVEREFTDVLAASLEDALAVGGAFDRDITSTIAKLGFDASPSWSAEVTARRVAAARFPQSAFG